MNSPFESVSDTAYPIAHHRAVESARRDALFRDPFAARLAGERGRRISAAVPGSRLVAWMVALRTRMIDEYLESALAAGVDTVLSLGAGLDARPYRLALPPGLRWIEADYPQIIDYKEGILAGETAHCRLERVKMDVASEGERRALLQRIDADSKGILVLTEGVIPYLDNDEAAGLAEALRALRHMRYWILDYMSEQAVQMRQRKRVHAAMQNAPFKFEPDDWFAFFRSHGWKVETLRYYPEEGARWGRPMPMPLIARGMLALTRRWISAERLEALEKFGGYALLVPAEPTPGEPTQAE